MATKKEEKPMYSEEQYAQARRFNTADAERHDVTANEKAKHMKAGQSYKVTLEKAMLLEAKGWINESGFGETLAKLLKK